MDQVPMWEGDRHFLPLVFDGDTRPFHGVMPYRSWDKMAEETQRDLRKQAAGFLKALDELPKYAD